LKRDPQAGDLFVFRGRRGDLIKIIWHDGLGHEGQVPAHKRAAAPLCIPRLSDGGGRDWDHVTLRYIGLQNPKILVDISIQA
jgi:hypothetical protein